MKLEDQVVSLELAKRLKELGVKQESEYWWVMQNEKGKRSSGPHLDHHYIFMSGWGEPDRFSYDRVAAAFTVAELGEMLKVVVKNDDEFGPGLPYWYDKFGKPAWQWEMKRFSKDSDSDYADTEADARAKMLIYLIENKLIELK